MAATVEGADTYFQTHLDSAKWATLTPERKAGAIATAQGDINSLPLRSSIPEATKDTMIYEQALFLAVIASDRQNLQAQGVASAAISGGASETYKKLTFGVALAPRAKVKATGYWALGAIS